MPAIGLAANDRTPEVRAAARNDFCHILRKPIQVQELNALLAEIGNSRFQMAA